MSSEIIQSVAYDNYDNFQHVNVIFSQNFISLFWGLFNDKTDLRGNDKHQNVLPRTLVEDANYPPNWQCEKNIKRFASPFLSFSDAV
jgi:hypothetical protein